jgi:hypothetical protein
MRIFRAVWDSVKGAKTFRIDRLTIKEDVRRAMVEQNIIARPRKHQRHREKPTSSDGDDGNPAAPKRHRGRGPDDQARIDTPVPAVAIPVALDDLIRALAAVNMPDGHTVTFAAAEAIAVPPPQRTAAMVASPTKPEMMPRCGICLATPEEGPMSLSPIIADCDEDSPAKCTHLVCSACMEEWVVRFLADANAKCMECTRCRDSHAALKRKHLDMNVARYMVDPQKFAWLLSSDDTGDDTRKTQIRTKTEYLRAFRTIFTSPEIEDAAAITAFEHQECPDCDSPAYGPVTAACTNLARCSKVDCMTVFCVHCRKTHVEVGMQDTHGPERCETLLRKKSIAAAPFDRTQGRACPYPDCDATSIQHYRGDGCHIVPCWKCSRSLCFVCGAIKLGSVHASFDGRTCGCAIWCGDSCTLCMEPPEERRARLARTAPRPAAPPRTTLAVPITYSRRAIPPNRPPAAESPDILDDHEEERRPGRRPPAGGEMPLSPPSATWLRRASRPTTLPGLFAMAFEPRHNRPDDGPEDNDED